MDDERTTPTPVPAPPTRPRGRRVVAAALAGALVATGGTAIAVTLANRSATGTTPAPTSLFGERGPRGSFGRADGMPGAGPGQGSTSSSDSTVGEATADEVVGLVRIATTTANGEAAGTGMILTADGEVVTNHHVVEGATDVTVTVMSTGESYDAEVVGTDSSDDVAVLQLEGANGLTPVSVDDAGVAVGDDVTAIGDAGGTSALSAAEGTVSALDQDITVGSEMSTATERLHGLIEIDAYVISGDSGGATVDSEGEVVGMTTAASTGSMNVTGYAIPIATVLSIVDRIELGESSETIHQGGSAFLGVELDSTTDSAAIGGVVDGSPAASAGLTAGDTITSLGGVPITSGSTLRAAIAQHSVGDKVSVSWTDARGASYSATVTLTDGPVQ